MKDCESLPTKSRTCEGGRKGRNRTCVTCEKERSLLRRQPPYLDNDLRRGKSVRPCRSYLQSDVTESIVGKLSAGEWQFFSKNIAYTEPESIAAETITQGNCSRFVAQHFAQRFQYACPLLSCSELSNSFLARAVRTLLVCYTHNAACHIISGTCPEVVLMSRRTLGRTIDVTFENKLGNIRSELQATTRVYHCGCVVSKSFRGVTAHWVRKQF